MVTYQERSDSENTVLALRNFRATYTCMHTADCIGN